MRLGHVGISVSNINRSAEFYCRWFGLKRSAVYRIKDAGLTIEMLEGAFTLELFRFQKREPLPAYRKALDSDLRTVGVKHFSVETSRIEELFRRLKKARVRFATPMRTFENGLRYFFIKDPDGILVEVMEAL